MGSERRPGVRNLGTLSWAASHVALAEHLSLQFRIDFWISVCSPGCGFLVFTDGEQKTRARPETLPGPSLQSLCLLQAALPAGACEF